MTQFDSRIRAAQLHLDAAGAAVDVVTVRRHAGAAHVSAVRAWRDDSASRAERAVAAQLRDAALSILDTINN